MTTPQQPPAGKGKLGRRNQMLLAGAAAAGVVAVAALARRNSAGSQPSPGTSGYADTGTATPYDYSGYGGDSGYAIQVSGLQDQLQALTTQVSTLSGQESRQQGQINKLLHPPRRKVLPGGGHHPPRPRKPKPRPKPKPRRPSRGGGTMHPGRR